MNRPGRRSMRGLARGFAAALGLAVILAACGSGSSSPSAPSGPLLTDPREILARSLTALNDARTFHLEGTLSGTLNADLTGSGTNSAIDLKGTSMSADADVPNQRATLSISVPALFALKVDYIQIGPDTYSRNSLDGSTWTHTSFNDSGSAGPSTGPSAGPSAGPVAVPTPRRIGTPAPATPSPAAPTPAASLDLVGQITAGLDRLPNPPTKGPDTACASKTCYSVSIVVPLSSGGQDALGLPLPSAAGATVMIDFEIEQDTLRPVQATASIDAGTTGTFTLALSLSKFDEPVSISPPPSDQVVEASPGG